MRRAQGPISSTAEAVKEEKGGEKKSALPIRPQGCQWEMWKIDAGKAALMGDLPTGEAKPHWSKSWSKGPGVEGRPRALSAIKAWREPGLNTWAP